MTEDPRARGVSSDEIERAQEMVRRGAAAQAAVDELGAGEMVKPHTIYLALQGIDSEGYSQVIGARTTLESAQALVMVHAGTQVKWLKGWEHIGSGTWFNRVSGRHEYYEVLAMTVTA